MLARMHCACAYFAPIAERIVRIDAPDSLFAAYSGSVRAYWPIFV